MELKVGSICDRGLNPNRPVNQDRFLGLPERGVFAVFDGVGGQRAGEVASQTAAETIEEAFKTQSGVEPAELIRRAIGFANRDIFEMSLNDPSFDGMATTIALLHIAGDRATIAHVGDSRVYRMENGRLARETVDHADSPSGSSGLAHRSNVINRALGAEPDVEPDIKSITLSAGTRFLLCSDGVYRHASDEQIERVLVDNPDPQRAAEALKRLAYAGGAEDNLTAVVVDAGKRASRVEGRSRRHDAKPDKFEVPLTSRPSPRTAGPEALDGGGLTRLLVRVLVVLVIAVGAFYAGLRASDLVRKPPSEGPSSELMEAARHSYESGDLVSAEARFRSLVEIDPESVAAHYWLGRTLLDVRQYADAAASFERAISLDQSFADGYLQAAAAYELMGEKQKAGEMMSRYVKRRTGSDASR